MYDRPIPLAQEKGHLSPLEMEQLKYVLQVGETMKAVNEYGNQVLCTPTDLTLQYLPARRLGVPKNLENQQPTRDPGYHCLCPSSLDTLISVLAK